MANAPTPDQVTAEAKKAAAANSQYSYAGNPYTAGDWSQVLTDCSGFVDRVFSNLGDKLPGTRPTTYDLAKMGTDEGTSITGAQAGDLILFDNNEHVGIYDGNGGVYNDPTTGESIQDDPVSYFGTISGIRRLTGSGTSSSSSAASSGSSIPVVGGAINTIDSVASATDAIGTVFTNTYNAATSAKFWIRIGLIFAGVIVLLIGIDQLTKGGISNAVSLPVPNTPTAPTAPATKSSTTPSAREQTKKDTKASNARFQSSVAKPSKLKTAETTIHNNPELLAAG